MVLTRLLLCAAFACSFTIPAKAEKSGIPPSFESYAEPAKPTTALASAKDIKLPGTFDEHLKSAVADAMSVNKPNFASHYLVVVAGCGAGCVEGAIIDLATGKSINFPFMILCKDPNYFKPVDFRLDSRLIAFKGSKNLDGSGNGEYYYELKKDKLNLIRTIALPEPSGPPQQWNGKQ